MGPKIQYKSHLFIAAAASLAVLAVGPSAAFAQDSAKLFRPAEPEPGVEIPAVNVNFGMRPYADNTFYVIGMKQGWYADVGITVTPEPLGLKLTDASVNPLLLNGQIDFGTQFCPQVLPTYKSTDKLKCVAFSDNFLGMAILARPELNLKGFKAFLAEGKPVEEAMHLAMAPLDGKTLVGSPGVGYRPFENAVMELAGVKWELETLEDSKAYVLAKSGRADFVSPGSAPIVYELQQAGWTTLIDIGDLFDHAPGGPDSAIAPLVANVGLAANADYVNANQNTVLRFLSVMWRTIDAVHKDPSLFDIQAPYLNSVSGTNLDGAGVKSTIEALDPLLPFDYGTNFYEDENSVVFYKNAWPAIIAEYVKNGTLPEGAVNADELIWGAAIWHQLNDYRTRSGELIKDLEQKELSAEAKDLLEKAKQHFEWFNFLDAFRFATAAAG
jgi:hypothetical protein